MDQKKIGGFILKMRKEKNMTQKDLADKLGVTDRAVSKWENGRGLPDLSLIQPLCEILGISVNEFFNAEKIEENQKKKKVYLIMNLIKKDTLIIQQTKIIIRLI